jgi:ParB-like chromosome segregation protein Spo0J
MAKTIGGEIRDIKKLIPELPWEITMVKTSKLTQKNELLYTDQDDVENIALSIQNGEMLNPIIVTKDFKIISGRHRFEAYKMLRKKEVPCRVIDVDDVQAKLLTIDENLVRRKLSVLETCEALLEKEQILKELHMRSQKEYDTFKKDSAKFALPQGIVNEISKTIGISKRSVYLKLKIAKNLDERASRHISFNDLENNQSQLEKISELKPEDQIALVKKVVYDEEDFNEAYAKVIQKNRNTHLIEDPCKEEPFPDEVDPELYEGYMDISERTDYFPMKSQNTKSLEEEDNEFEFTEGKQKEQVYKPDFEIVRINKNAYNKAMMYANERQETIEQLIEQLIDALK